MTLPRVLASRETLSESVAWAGTRTREPCPPLCPRLALQWNFPRKGAGGSRSPKPWRARNFPIPPLPASPLPPPPQGAPLFGMDPARSCPPPAGCGRGRPAPPPGTSHRRLRPSSLGVARPPAGSIPAGTRSTAARVRPRSPRPSSRDPAPGTCAPPAPLRAAAAGGLGMLSCGAAGRRGSRAHAFAGPSARRPGARHAGGRCRRRPGQPAQDAGQDGLSHGIR